jgi:hypothetical protein
VDGRPWDRQPKEGAKPYGWFLAYRDLGPQRTIPGVRSAFGEGSVSERLLERWSSAWKWPVRARLWDLECQRVKDEEALADAAKWERRRLETREIAYRQTLQLRAKAQAMLAAPLPPRWTLRDVAALLQVAQEAEAEILAQVSRPPGSTQGQAHRLPTGAAKIALRAICEARDREAREHADEP